eukprot:14100_1
MMSAFCTTVLKLLIVLIISIILIPIIILLLLIHILLFIIRLPLYLYHKCKQEWYSKNFILPPVSMGFVTKIFYNGQNPCYDGSTLICVTLYLNKEMSKEMVINKFGFVYEFSRFRYIPYWSWWTGIAEFSYLNDTNEINPNDISPHIHQHTCNLMQLQNTINNACNTCLNPNLPWWDIHIIHYNNNNEIQPETNFETILVFRCNHCLGDGATLMKFLLPRLLSNSDGKPIDFNVSPRKPAYLSYCIIFSIIINALWFVYALLIKTSDTFHAIFIDMRA